MTVEWQNWPILSTNEIGPQKIGQYSYDIQSSILSAINSAAELGTNFDLKIDQ